MEPNTDFDLIISLYELRNQIDAYDFLDVNNIKLYIRDGKVARIGCYYPSFAGEYGWCFSSLDDKQCSACTKCCDCLSDIEDENEKENDY